MNINRWLTDEDSDETVGSFERMQKRRRFDDERERHAKKKQPRRVERHDFAEESAA